MTKTAFVIKYTDCTGYVYYVGEGGFYRFQGEKYVVICERRDEAKKYTSFARADNAAKKLRSCANALYDYEIQEVSI